MRMLGAVVVVYGLALAIIGGNPSAGFIVAVAGWAIRRYYRPQPASGRYRRL